MGFASVLLSSCAAFAAAIASALGGSGFWMSVLVFYGAGFGTLALLIAWQILPPARVALTQGRVPAVPGDPM